MRASVSITRLIVQLPLIFLSGCGRVMAGTSDRIRWNLLRRSDSHD
jgi:hypothetical protein